MKISEVKNIPKLTIPEPKNTKRPKTLKTAKYNTHIINKTTRLYLNSFFLSFLEKSFASFIKQTISRIRITSEAIDQARISGSKFQLQIGLQLPLPSLEPYKNAITYAHMLTTIISRL